MPAEPSDITLPPDLIPGDGRFGSGPAKVRPVAFASLAATANTWLGTSHRQDPVRSVVGRIRCGLGDLLGLPDGYEVALGIGGATLFWEVATCSLIHERSQHLVFGEFSSKFAAVAASAPFLKDPVVVESATGTHPELIADESVDVYALTHNETSTGVTMPVARPGPVAGDGRRATDALVVVDATSAAGGLMVDPTTFDAYYFSPQKCFASEGGLWVAALSPAAIVRAERTVRDGRWVPPMLDLTLAIDNSRKDQTYNTPALATLWLLAEQVDWINGNGGLGWSAARCAESARTIYDWADAAPYANPFVSVAAQRSNTVATIDLDAAIDAPTVSAILRRHGIVDTDSYRKLGRNQLRITLYPAIEPEDVAVLTRAIDHIVGVLGGQR